MAHCANHGRRRKASNVFTTLDRYVLKQVSTPLVAALGVGLTMLLAERLVRLLDNTLGKKSSFAVVFELLAYLVPHYLGLAIPAALFLGLLFGFNKMSKDSEIDAFQATGAGLHRLTRPVIVLSAILALLSFATFGWIQPHARYAYRAAMFNVVNVEVFYLAEEGVFMQSGTRTFILDNLDRSTNSFSHVFLFDYRGKDGSDTLTASNGSLVNVPGSTRPVLHLADGHRLKFDSWTGPRDDGVVPLPQAGEFKSADTPLGRIAPEAFRPRGKDERELTLPELASHLDSPPEGATIATMQAEFHKRLVSVLALLILPVLAVPFAVGRHRGQRAYRFGVALVLIVAFHEVIEQGALATRASGMSPWLTMWLPLLLLAAFALSRYRRACFTLKPDGLDGIAEALTDAGSAVRKWLFARFGLGQTT